MNDENSPKIPWIHSEGESFLIVGEMVLVEGSEQKKSQIVGKVHNFLDLPIISYQTDT